MLCFKTVHFCFSVFSSSSTNHARKSSLLSFFSFRRGTFCTVFVVALPLALERVVCTLSSPRIEAPGTRARRSLLSGLVITSRFFGTSGIRQPLWFDTSSRVGRVVSPWRSSGCRTWRWHTMKRGRVKPWFFLFVAAWLDVPRRSFVAFRLGLGLGVATDVDDQHARGTLRKYQSQRTLCICNRHRLRVRESRRYK